MSPPTKAPLAPELDGQNGATAAPGAATHGSPAMAPPHAAALGGQQTAGNRAMAAVLGALIRQGQPGVQRAPDEDSPDPKVSGMAYAPTLDPRPSPAPNVSSQTAGAPTLPAPPNRPPKINSGVAHGPTLDPRGSPAPTVGSPTALAPTQAPAGPLQLNTDTPVSGMGNPAPPLQVNTNTPISGMGNPAAQAPGGPPAPGGPSAPGPAGGGTPGPARGAPGDPDFVRGGPLPQGGAVFGPREQWWQSDPRFAVGGEYGPKPVGPGQFGGRAKPVSVDPVPTPVNAQIVGPAFDRDPSRVIRSPDMDFHQQAWGFARGPQAFGTAPPPQAFTDGRFYFVAPDYPGKATELPGYAATGDVGLGKPGAGGPGAGPAPATPRVEASGPAPAPPDKMRQAVAPYTPYTGEPRGTQKAQPATFSEVQAALSADPSKVVRSPNDRWHRQGYQADGGGRYPPGAFKVGDLYVVSPDYPIKGVPKLGEEVPAKPSAVLAAQTISPTGFVPQERKPAKWDVKGGEVSRETAQEEKRTTDQGSQTRTRASKQSYGLAKGAGQEWKQREESQAGDKFTAREQSTKANLTLEGLTLNRGSTQETGATPDGPKTKTERNVGGTLGPEGATGTASTAITSQSGTKAEAKGDVKLGPNGIELTGTGSITTSRGFKGHLSVSGKSNIVASDPKPLPNGKFAVEFVKTDASGVELGGGYSKPSGGPSVSVQVGSSTSTSDYQTRVFDSREEAVRFQLTAALQVSADTRSFEKATSADDVLAMKEGEVRGTSQTDTDSLGASGGISVVSAGVTSTDSTTTGLKIEKRAGNKVRVTPSIAEQEALNASISVAGAFSNTKGGSETNSFSVTYEFDLGTDGGRQAYETYKKRRFPPPMPPHAKWIDNTTGRQIEDHDVYKFGAIGEIGWGSHASQQTVVDEGGTHTTAVGGQSEKVDLGWARKLTFDENRHAEANIIGKMSNGRLTHLAGQLTVGGEDGSFNRDQFRKIFSDKGAPKGTAVRSSGEWTLSAEIDKKAFEELEQINDRMIKAKTREERLKIYSELAQRGGAQMLGGQVRRGGRKLAWNLELKGDPNFPGAAGRAQLDHQRAQLLEQLKQPDGGGGVARQAKETLEALQKRLAAVSDETKYTDLPTELRQEQVNLINHHISQFQSLRSQALSVQMRGGDADSMKDVRARAGREDGYKGVPKDQVEVKKLRDAIRIKEEDIAVIAREIEATNGILRRFVVNDKLRRSNIDGTRVKDEVYSTHNTAALVAARSAHIMDARLKASAAKAREIRKQWDAGAGPQDWLPAMRALDAELKEQREIAKLELENLQEAIRHAYIVAPDSAIGRDWAYFNSIKADGAARAVAISGFDEE